MTEKKETALATLDVKRFDPLKKEVSELVRLTRSTVASMTAACPYELMKESKDKLADKRISFVKDLKAERASALAYQKGIVAVENELLALVEPLETELKEKIKAIEDEEIKEKRRYSLPERKEKLAAIGVEVEDDVILMMDGIKFAAFFNEKNALYLEEEQRKIQEEKDRIEREKIEAEQAVKREQELEEARKQAEEKAKADYERKLQEQKDELERQKREEEQRKIREEEARKQAEIEEKARMEKDKKYQEFLEKCGYNEQDFKIERTGNTVICYKKVGEITL